MNQQIIR
jgi:Reverse transcriptase (RNA-dependent DNA polymerase)